MNKDLEVAEKLPETTPKCSIPEMTYEQKRDFCSFLVGHGANFYTVRDKLLYDYRLFDAWEVVGIGQMVQTYAPDYKGKLPDFFNTLENKADFVKFMVSHGNMGRTTCYTRFTKWNFKPWEVLGLITLANDFLNKGE